ncbi:hypothetical protein NL676_009453 [Syzygium grande]|nr:hypothetical protein NL676_009453 [Syzygium grande]
MYSNTSFHFLAFFFAPAFLPASTKPQQRIGGSLVSLQRHAPCLYFITATSKAHCARVTHKTPRRASQLTDLAKEALARGSRRRADQRPPCQNILHRAYV